MDRLPSDEGSDIDSAGDAESTVDDDDVDDDNGGGGGAIVDNAPADEGKPASESAPVETGTAHAILDHTEQALVADCAFRLSTLNAVLEQLKPLRFLDRPGAERFALGGEAIAGSCSNEPERGQGNAAGAGDGVGRLRTQKCTTSCCSEAERPSLEDH